MPGCAAWISVGAGSCRISDSHSDHRRKRMEETMTQDHVASDRMEPTESRPQVSLAGELAEGDSLMESLAADCMEVEIMSSRTTERTVHGQHSVSQESAMDHEADVCTLAKTQHDKFTAGVQDNGTEHFVCEGKSETVAFNGDAGWGYIDAVSGTAEVRHSRQNACLN